jgi:membrane fusion protein (multidrug efflux system)
MYSLDLLPVTIHVGVGAMNLIVFTMQQSFATVMLVVALASGGGLGLSKVRARISPLLDAREVYTDLGSTGAGVKPMKGQIAGQFEWYFHRPHEQPSQGQRKIVVTSPKALDVTVTQPYICQIHAQHHINVRSSASGTLAEISVKEGQAVKKGDLMFKIGRAKPRARADPSQAELEATDIIAPFDGIVGRLHEQLGSPIKEGHTLTTLSDNRVVWVYFNVPEKQYLDYMVNRKQREQDKIELELPNHTKFPQPGKISAIEAKFNPKTGNIAFRADFPNPDSRLQHGQAGTILIHRKLHDVTVIPQRATYEFLDTRYIYVVDKDDVVHRREIAIEYETDDIFVIKKGVGVGEKIVLEGARQVRDGEKVEYEFRPLEDVRRQPNNRAQ